MTSASTEDTDELGFCGRYIDVDKDIVCDREAVTDIIVTNAFGKFLVPLCGPCSSEHRAFYSERRRTGHKRRARSSHRARV